MVSVLTSYKSTFTVVSLFLLILLFSRVSVATEPLVNINRAGVEELAEKLSGIGPAKAKAILIYRELHGPFKTVDELIKVKGIGPRTLEKIRLQLVVYANDQLVQNHETIASNASDNARSEISKEQKTRRAVRSVIEAARHDSTKLKH